MTALTRGTINSAQAASDFIGSGAGTGILDVALLANGWTYIETVHREDTGGESAASPMYVWCSPGTTRRADPTQRTEMGTRSQSWALEQNAIAPDGVTAATDTTMTSSPHSDMELGYQRSLDGLTGFNHQYDGTVLFFSAVNASGLVRIRATERYTTGPTYRQQAPVTGNNTGNAATPTATNTARDLDDTIVGNFTSTYIGAVAFANSSAVNWILKVTSDMLYLGTRSGGNNWFVITGQFTSLMNAFSPQRRLFMAGHDANSLAFAALGFSVRTSRHWGQGAIAGNNRWSHAIDYPVPTYLQNSTALGADATAGLGTITPGGASVASKGFSFPLVSDAFLWGGNAGPTGGGEIGPFGYIPDTIVGTSASDSFVCGGNDTIEVYKGGARLSEEFIPGRPDPTEVGLPPIDESDTFTKSAGVGREQYWILGTTRASGTGRSRLYVAIK